MKRRVKYIKEWKQYHYGKPKEATVVQEVKRKWDIDKPLVKVKWWKREDTTVFLQYLGFSCYYLCY